MSLLLRYTIVVLAISVIAVVVGCLLLFSAFHERGKGKETKLALGNVLIAVGGAVGSAFAADVFRPVDVESLHKEVVSALSNAPTFSSDARCLDEWHLPGEIWHYSLTRVGGSSAWQVARPVFSRPVPTRIIGHGVWLNALSRSRTTYEIEAGCRGKRGILTFTLATGDPDTIPTVEVYPQLPNDNLQPQIIGYAIDRTWDDHEVLAPTMVSRVSLHGSGDIGPITNPVINASLSELWHSHYEHQIAGEHECTLCPLAADR